jgi:hypothetical protein
MYPHTTQQTQVSQTLRAVSADSLKMEVPRASLKNPTSDSNPLHRPWNPLRGMDVWESNQNMCTALWQLMSRC